MLSGDELVAKGATKIDASLPEIGLKYVVPNKSWLEQKQIQAAVESRKHLIEIPRIEKSGTISHAEWKEDLGLAEVTKQTGSCWQYFSHQIGNTLFLKPEEALFLIEVNSLLLKYNGIPVSLEQAYSLLLRDKILLKHYKVYAALSRQGYRVYRHEKPKESQKKDDDDNIELNKNSTSYTEFNESCNKDPELDAPDNKEQEVMLKASDNSTSENVPFDSKTNSDQENIADKIRNQIGMEITEEIPVNNSVQVRKVDDIQTHSNSQSTEAKLNATKTTSLKQTMLENLMQRQYKSLGKQAMDRFFEGIPDMCHKREVVVNAPSESFIPRNIFLNKTNYALDLQNLQHKNKDTTWARTYSASDEVNGANIRRIRSSSTETPPCGQWNNYQYNTFRYHRNMPPHFWQFRGAHNFHQRPRMFNNNLFMNLLFQRPYFVQNLTRMQFQQRPPVQFTPRPQIFINRGVVPPQIQPNRHLEDYAKSRHFRAIKDLASKLRTLVRNGNNQTANVQSLEQLINTFNSRYRTRIRLNSSLEIVDENVIETIELEDDDDEPRNKLPRLENIYDERLETIKNIAIKMREAKNKGQMNSRLKRAFSSVVKAFNKCFDADIYWNDNFDVLDRNNIVIDSSESDCVIEEVENKKTRRKKLINPFSILKKKFEESSSSNKNGLEPDTKYSEYSNYIPDKWLTKENDFGQVESVSKSSLLRAFNGTLEELFLLDFITNVNMEFTSWLSLKLAFWDSYKDMPMVVEKADMQNCEVPTNSLVKPKDCDDVASVLEKLRIVETNKEISKVCNLEIDFDVYNKEVTNFRKSDKPTPNFRIICAEETSEFPPSDEVAALHMKYQDNVPIVFAVVGIGSISYLQLLPSDIPVYIPPKDTSLDTSATV